MKMKSIFMILIILTLGLFVSGCGIDNAMPAVIPLEESVKEIINSKGENYDFLADELYNIKMEELMQTILSKLKNYNIVYKLGDLDGDDIPEVAVFIERNPEDIKDEGLLQIYKFNGERYGIIDEINMNYDNNNYGMEIGKISEDQQGLLINNQVGAHAGITYGFILKDGKLKSILNQNKIHLLSVYTSNEIKDINNDGVLDFSIFTINPETEEQSAVGSDKMTLWYKWDGFDAGILIRVDSEPQILVSDSIVFEEINSLMEADESLAIRSLIENQFKMSYVDNTILLTKYIEQLEKTTDEIDYSKLIEQLGDSISKEYRDYLSILAFNINEPYLIDDSLMVSPEILGNRINFLENFLITYPYSSHIQEVDNIYKSYNKYFIFGDNNSPNFIEESNKIQDGVIDNWNLYIEKYPNSYFANVLTDLASDIKASLNMLTPETKQKYNYIYK